MMMTEQGGGEVPAKSLVEQAADRAEIELRELFSQPDAPEVFLPRQVVQMLATPARPLYVAMEELAFLPPQPSERSFSVATNKPYLRTSVYASSQPEILALNRHRLARTAHISEISQRLDFSITQIAEVARDTATKPLLADTNKPQHELLDYHGYFDLDQVQVLGKGLERYNAPTDRIARSKVMAALNLSRAALTDLVENLEIETEIFRNVETGMGEDYFTEPDIAKLIQFMKRHRGH